MKRKRAVKAGHDYYYYINTIGILLYNFTLKKVVNTSYKTCIRVNILTHQQLMSQKSKYPHRVFSHIFLAVSVDDLIKKREREEGMYLCTQIEDKKL